MKDDLFIFDEINKEIATTEDLLDHMGQGFVLGEKADLSNDIGVMKNKVSILKDAKEMIRKSALTVEGVDNMLLMSVRQKRMFLSIVKFVSWFRRK